VSNVSDVREVRVRGLSTGILLSSLALGLPGQASEPEYERSFEFDDGMLPSTAPDLEYVVGDEGANVSVANGVMTHDTTVSGAIGLYQLELPVDLDAGFRLATRLRIEDYEGLSSGGFLLAIGDENRAFNIYFGSDGATINQVLPNGGDPLLFDVSYDREYVLQAEPGSNAVRFWIDEAFQGLFLDEGTASPRELLFGGGSSPPVGSKGGGESDARAVVDYIRLTIPEPGAGLASAAALAVLAALRGCRGSAARRARCLRASAPRARGEPSQAQIRRVVKPKSPPRVSRRTLEVGFGSHEFFAHRGRPAV